MFLLWSHSAATSGNRDCNELQMHTFWPRQHGHLLPLYMLLTLACHLWGCFLGQQSQIQLALRLLRKVILFNNGWGPSQPWHSSPSPSTASWNVGVQRLYEAACGSLQHRQGSPFSCLCSCLLWHPIHARADTAKSRPLALAMC